MFFKRNIWIIFYALLASSILVLVAVTYAKAQLLSKEQAVENASITRLLSVNFNAALTQNELLLDILGNRLLENQLYKNQTASHLLLKQMMKNKPELAGFGLAKPNGDFMAVSGNLRNLSHMPNLLKLTGSRESFQRALKSNHLEVGQTYYFSPLDAWVIPLRKALRDKNGKVVAVMTTGMRIQNNAFLKLNSMTEGKAALFVNQANLYRIYAAGAPASQYKHLYSQPINPKIVKHFVLGLKKLYGYDLKDVDHLTHTKIFQMTGYSEFIQADADTTAVFDPRYKIWTFLLQPSRDLNHKILQAFWQYFTVVVVFNLVIFWLVKLINSYEERSRRQLLHQANHDSLTGLYNRHFLQSNFNDRLPQNAMSLLFIDLDNFKTINDNFGHTIGDQILCQVSERLNSFVQPDELIVRFGGDEFLLLSLGYQDEFQLAQQIITTLSTPYHIDDMTFTLGACIGISKTDTTDNLSLDTLISQADMAMYSAKEFKNSVAYYSESLLQQNARKMHIEQQLRHALKRNEIHLVYQPQIHQAGHIHGVEALARWENPILGSVPPSEFIPIAEEIGIMPELGLFVAKTAIQEICALQQALDQRFKLSINISVKQLLATGFFDEFEHLVSHCPMNAINLTLEVTESVFIEDIDQLLPVLNSLKSLGTGLSIDDFGTGYSSLNLLRFLPLDELKIDKSFVDLIHKSDADQKLVKTIINIAQQMNAHPLAEGVERAEQLEVLKQYGCTIFQGYYFSKPLAPEDLMTFLEQLP